MKKQSGYRSIGFNEFLIRDEVNDSIKKSIKESEEQEIRDLQKLKIEKEIELIDNPVGLDHKSDELKPLIEELSNLHDAITSQTLGDELIIKQSNLLIIENKNIFTYHNNKVVTTESFDITSNEFAILMHFVNNRGIEFTSKSLVPYLVKKPRLKSNPEEARRVKDVVKAIRNKLGKKVIITDNQTYKMVCEVHII